MDRSHSRLTERPGVASVIMEQLQNPESSTQVLTSTVDS